MDIDRRGLIGTIAFHVILLLLFILSGFRTPLPLPGEAGILVNFGDIDLAAGNEEPRINEEIVTPPKQEEIEETVEEILDEEPILTQEVEDAPEMVAVKKPEKKPEKEKKPVEKKTEPTPKVEKPIVEEKPQVNTAALYSGKKENTTYTGSQGNASGTGNQGTPTGSVNATDYGLGGGSGNRPGFFLDGRNSVSLPTPRSDSQKEGKIVVQIKVNRAGEVVEAVPGIKGSTTLDTYLLGVAKKAALSSKFDSKADAAFYQTGSITYIFRVK